MDGRSLEKADAIICERSSSWAAAMRAMVMDIGARIRETRTLAECEIELEHSPTAVVAVEVTAENLARTLHCVDAWRATYPGALPVALLAREDRQYEEVLREAGAAHVATGPRRLHGIAELIEVRTRRRSGRPNMLEQVWAGLPWDD